MSELRGRRSPYEQGELKPSPERHSKKKKSSKKSKKSHQLPPEAKLHIRTADEDDDVQVIEAADHGEEEGGSLTIKPPQLQVQKREKRHKRDKHRFREHGSSRERGRVEKTDIIKDKWKAHPPARDFRDAREIVREKKKERELKEKELSREMKEREERKREESIKERERLERLELERRRERQMREDHEKDKQARQQKRKDDRRQIIDSRRERAKVGDERQMSEHHRSRSRDRERARDKGQTRHFPPPPRLQEDKVSKKEKAYSSAPKSLSKSEDVEIIDVEQDTRRVVVEEPTEEKLKKRERKVEEVEDSVSEKRDAAPLAGKRLARESPSKDAAAAEEEEEESEESDSDSGESGSDTSSGDEESSEEEEDDDEDDEEEDEKVPDEEEQVGRKAGPGKQEDIHEDSRDKLRSKFDDHSDAESPVLGSDHTPDDYMIPDSPDMSDVELAPEDTLPLYLPAIQGCRSVEEFNCLNRIEEGTYGVVYRALDKKTNEIVALKRLKMEKEKEGFPITSLREINTLLKAQHENIVTVREIVVGSNMDKIYIVMDFVEHDLKSLMENMKNPFLVGEVKTLIQQLLRATRHLHDNWILHRDLKTSNLLLSHKGILKVGDFGLAREYGSPLRHYTPVVVTLWYRAPELLLGCKEYSTHVDMWSVGCIFAELLLRKALWPGKSEIDQINKIFKDLGTPTEKIWPGVSELPGMKKINFHDNPYNVIRNRFGSYFTDHGFDLLNRFFAYDPVKRITADEALDHEYFRESPLPVDPSMFPTWPARSEQTRKHSSSPKPPSGGKAYQKLLDDEENFAAGGFHMPSAAKGVSAQGMGFSLKF